MEQKKINYPDHLIDPRQKGEEWIRQYMVAAWGAYNGGRYGSLYGNGVKYQEIKDYATGQQSIDRYKPMLEVDDSADESYLNINWKVVPIYPKFRRLAIARLCKVMYDVSADPIDTLAKSETEESFKKMEARIKLRNEIESIEEGLSNITPLSKQEGEAESLDELELQKKYTYKHHMAIEMEQALTLVLFTNNYKEIRKTLIEDLYDHGFAGVKEWIDEKGAVRVRRVDPNNVIISRVEDKTFKGLQHAGEVKMYTISELKQMAGSEFTEDQYKDMAENVCGKYGNSDFIPTSNINTSGYAYDDFKINVLEMEFFSVNKMFHETKKDKRNNTHITRTKFGKKGARQTSVKVVYKGSWIIGTNYMFNYGLATDMKRQKSRLMDTTLSYHFRSINFNNMQFSGITEQCMSVIDNFQLTWYKYQHAIAEARPKGVMIEATALENIALGDGGETLDPMDILDLYTKKGILVYRAFNDAGEFLGFKPIEELKNGLGDEAARYFAELQNIIQLIREITGLNELTDGSTPDSRTLTTVANLANEGTNNSLWPVLDADINLFEELCSDLTLRIQSAVKKGPVEGYSQALGDKSVDFIKVSKNVSMHEYGIEITAAPTEQEKEALINEAKAYSMEGLISFEDVIMIKNSRNLKVAEAILAYRIKKRQEDREKHALATQEATAKGQQQAAMVAAEEARKTAQFNADLKTKELELKFKLDKEMRLAVKAMELKIAEVNQEGRVAANIVNNESKEYINKNQTL